MQSDQTRQISTVTETAALHLRQFLDITAFFGDLTKSNIFGWVLNF